MPLLLSSPRSWLKWLILALMTTTVVVALPQIDPGLGEEDITYSVDFIMPGRRNTATKENQEDLDSDNESEFGEEEEGRRRVRGGPSLIQAIQRERGLGIFLSHLKEAGLTQILGNDDDEDSSSAGGFTIFAPTDRAWAKLPRKDLRAILKDEEALLALLHRHIGTKELFAEDLLPEEGAGSSHSQLVPTLGGEYVTVTGSRASSGKGSEDRVTVMSSVTAAEVKEEEVVASNGVIHIISTVL